MNKLKNYFLYNPTKTISYSFIVVIMIGTLLLSLPISNQVKGMNLINHLFVATSATCVTGLTPVVILDQYTLFGQLVILCMIQIGGLGFITFLMLMYLFLKKKLSFSTRLLMAESINQSSLDSIDYFIHYIFKYTFNVESLGAMCLFCHFIQKYSFMKALYYSVFHSISAFCNAGFDLIGDSSLSVYSQNPYVLFIIGLLIILGGIGFIVSKEILDKVKQLCSKEKPLKYLLKTLSLHTKIVLVMTIGLIFIGGILIYFMEYNNPKTIGNMPFIHQLTNSLFLSVSYRTAGFATFNQANLLDHTKLFGCLIMLIGGSPAGTAGGIKTLTVAVLFLSVRATLKGNKNVFAFSRSISREDVDRAISVICISIVVIISSSIVLAMIEPHNLIDIFYEVFSAFATVGLSANLTGQLTFFGKIIIILLMYIGRIGPVTMMLTLMKKSILNIGNEINYPQGKIIVG